MPVMRWASLKHVGCVQGLVSETRSDEQYILVHRDSITLEAQFHASFWTACYEHGWELGEQVLTA